MQTPDKDIPTGPAATTAKNGRETFKEHLSPKNTESLVPQEPPATTTAKHAKTHSSGLADSKWATADNEYSKGNTEDLIPRHRSKHTKKENKDEEEEERNFGARLSGSVPSGPASTVSSSHGMARRQNHGHAHSQAPTSPSSLSSDGVNGTPVPRQALKPDHSNGPRTKQQHSLSSIRHKPSTTKSHTSPNEPVKSRWQEERERNRSKKLDTERTLEWNNTSSENQGVNELKENTDTPFQHQGSSSPLNSRYSSRGSSGPGSNLGSRYETGTGRSWGDKHGSLKSNTGGTSRDMNKSNASHKPPAQHETESQKQQKAQQEEEDEQKTSQSLLELMTKKVEHFNWADEE